MSFSQSAGSATIDSTVPLGANLKGLAVSQDTHDSSDDQAPGEQISSEQVAFLHTSDTSRHDNCSASEKSGAGKTEASHITEAWVPHRNSNGLPTESNSLSEDAILNSNPRPMPMRSHPSKPKDQVHGFSPTFLDDESEFGEPEDVVFGLSSAESSCATDETFSPEIPSWPAQSVPISPIQLSQPETPTMSEFDDDATSWKRGSDSIDVDAVHLKAPSRAAPLPPPSSQAPTFANPFRIHASLSGFQGYSLPQNEQGSMHTLRKPASKTSFHTDHPLRHQASSEDLVHSWNDGSEHRVTALEDLIDDHGYLGAFIL